MGLFWSLFLGFHSDICVIIIDSEMWLEKSEGQIGPFMLLLEFSFPVASGNTCVGVWSSRRDVTSSAGEEVWSGKRGGGGTHGAVAPGAKFVRGTKCKKKK